MTIDVLVAGLAAVAGVMGALFLQQRGRVHRAEARAAELAQQVSSRSEAGSKEERLLAAVAEATPLAMVLFSDQGRIAFTNTAARDLFFDGAAVEGWNFLRILERAPEALRRSLVSDSDELFTVESDGEVETFYLAKRHLDVGGEPHTLVFVKPITQEVARQEVATLKKVIRLLAHEANNSLGPISSLMGSARTIVEKPEMHGKLVSIFATVEERAAHLQRFLGGYAAMARLPDAQRRTVPWGPFLAGLRALWPQIEVAPAPEQAGYFDPGQIEQVLINLVKNAIEAGSAPADVKVEVAKVPEGGFRVTVLDRGTGMTDEVMRNAVLPFFSTKSSGSGLGLALSREVVEQHRGRLRLARREGGGMAISLYLPERETAANLNSSRVRLSLTRT